MNSEVLVLIVVLQIVSIAIGALLWHKVRRIHLSSYRLDDLLTQTHQEAHALYAQLAALSALDRTLAMAHPLPSMRGWAGSPDFLLHVAQHLLKHQPSTIVECSSGVSTVVSARCCQLNKHGHVYSMEHDAQYAEKTRRMLADHGLSEWATVIHAPLAQGTDGLSWYQDGMLPPAVTGIDVLVIDGPPKASAEMARYPAMTRLASRFSEHITVFLDDAGRDDERAIVKKWLLEHPDFTASHEIAEKGLTVLTRTPRPH